MKCDYHPEREAVGTCVGCGRGICEFCKTILNDKLYCPTCAERSVLNPEKPQTPIISAQATKDGAKVQPQNTGISSSSVDTPVKKGPSTTLKIIIGIVVVVLIIIVIGAIAGGGSNTTTATPTPTPTPTPTSATTATPISTSPTYTPVPTTQPCSGQTAICNDGTCSNAANHQGACSQHGGVRTWLK